jgi:hypothetical protein
MQNNILAESHDLSTYGKSELPRCNSNSGQYVWDKCLGSEGGYVGEFRNNKREGLGVFTAKEGWKYVGEFKDDQFQGEGLKYDSKGNKLLSGNWRGVTLVKGYPIELNRFPFNLFKRSSEISITEKINTSLLQDKTTKWDESISKVVIEALRAWLEEGVTAEMQEVTAPVFPPALKIIQERWESNKEFEDRLVTARSERQTEIDRIQAEYKAKVRVIRSLTRSIGLFISRTPASTNPQLASGPQKWIVFGPTGEFMKAIKLKLLDIFI